MRQRAELCVKENLGRNCILETTPLSDFEVQNTLQDRTGRERMMLEALATLTVKEDFCVPEACDDEDVRGIMFSHFKGIEIHRQLTITCVTSGQGAMAFWAILTSFLVLSCFGCVWFVMKPPKMVREYKIRRSSDD